MDTDYHFIRGKEVVKSPNPVQKKSGILGSLKLFLPVFVLSALLPVFMMAMMNPGTTRVLTRADENAQLRIWMEPKTVITGPGQPVELTIVSSLDTQGLLPPPIEVTLSSSEEVDIDNTEITFLEPVVGKATLGIVSVQAYTPGTYTINVSNDSVLVPNLATPLQILSSPATLVVR